MTEANRSRSADIAHRERRYLIMMAFRVVCFVVAVVLYAQGAGWLAAIPAVGAIVLPYFAVVLANGGREPSNPRGFREYEPNLPALYTPPGRAPGDNLAAVPADRQETGKRAAGRPGPGPSADATGSVPLPGSRPAW